MAKESIPVLANNLELANSESIITPNIEISPLLVQNKPTEQPINTSVNNINNNENISDNRVSENNFYFQIKLNEVTNDGVKLFENKSQSVFEGETSIVNNLKDLSNSLVSSLDRGDISNTSSLNVSNLSQIIEKGTIPNLITTPNLFTGQSATNINTDQTTESIRLIDKIINTTVPLVSNNVSENIFSENMNSLVRSENNLSENMNSLVRSENNLSENMNSLVRSENNFSENMNSLVRSENNLSENMNSLVRSENNFSENMNSLVRSENNLSEKMNSLVRSENNFSENMNSLVRSENNLSEKMNSLVRSENNFSENMNSLVRSENNFSENMNSLVRSENNFSENMNSLTNYVSVLDKIVETNTVKKLETDKISNLSENINNIVNNFSTNEASNIPNLTENITNSPVNPVQNLDNILNNTSIGSQISSVQNLTTPSIIKNILSILDSGNEVDITKSSTPVNMLPQLTRFSIENIKNIQTNPESSKAIQSILPDTNRTLSPLAEVARLNNFGSPNNPNLSTTEVSPPNLNTIPGGEIQTTLLETPQVAMLQTNLATQIPQLTREISAYPTIQPLVPLSDQSISPSIPTTPETRAESGSMTTSAPMIPPPTENKSEEPNMSNQMLGGLSSQIAALTSVVREISTKLSYLDEDTNLSFK
jgi:predicted  nucleic acid-binding Zn-ribbon protein